MTVDDFICEFFQEAFYDVIERIRQAMDEVNSILFEEREKYPPCFDISAPPIVNKVAQKPWKKNRALFRPYRLRQP